MLSSDRATKNLLNPRGYAFQVSVVSGSVNFDQEVMESLPQGTV